MANTKERNEEKIREMLLYSTPEEIYDKVLSGELERFPAGFWSMPENYDYAKKCIKHLIEDILKYPIEEIPTYYTARFLLTYKLSGMLGSVFGSNLFESLECAYPGQFKPFMFQRVSQGYWSPSTVSEAMHWLIDEKLKITEEEFVSSLSVRFLTEHNLITINKIYSLHEILEFTYPGKYKEWDLNVVRTSSAFARGEEEQIKDFLMQKIKEFNFKPQDYTASAWTSKVNRGFLTKLSPTNIYKMTCEIYYKLDTNNRTKTYDSSTKFLASPEEVYEAFLQGKIARFPRGYWVEDGALERSARCVRYLVEEVLHLEVSQVPTVLYYPVFRKYKLCGMIGLLFPDCYKKAIVNAYPERFELVGLTLRTIE